MQFENSFTVAVPIDAVWDKLLDVPSVAPCVPGAELTEVVSDSEYKGTVTIKLGAVKMTYRGTVNIQSVDRDSRQIILKASGSDSRGGGGASATVTTTMVAGDGETTVNMVSDVAVTGRVAQFGRNIIQDVANRLIQDFARCLESNLTEQSAVDGPSDSKGEASSETSEEASAPSEPSSSGQAAAELKMLPIVMDITRSRLADGLGRLAKVIDPKREENE